MTPHHAKLPHSRRIKGDEQLIESVVEEAIDSDIKHALYGIS